VPQGSLLRLIVGLSYLKPLLSVPVHNVTISFYFSNTLDLGIQETVGTSYTK